MRVLVIQLKRLGDLVLTSPVFSALRDALPGAHLALAAAGGTEGLASLIDADERLYFGNGRGDWPALWRGRFDVCLDFTGNDRSLLVALLSRARRKITYRRFAGKPFRRRVFTDFVDSSVSRRHTADHHTDLLRPLGIFAEGVSSRLAEPPLPAGLPENYTVIHAGTARAEKYWPADRWAELARRLAREPGWPLVFTGGRGPEEQAHLREILAVAPAGALDLSGKIRLDELAAVIRGAKLLVSVDSVPVHLADAFRTPVVALFGPTDPFHWRPRFARCEIVKAESMAALSGTEVEAAVGRILAGDRP